MKILIALFVISGGSFPKLNTIDRAYILCPYGKFWGNNGILHRNDDLPAVVCDYNGILHKEWWINGIRHREDGPAIERMGGDKLWYSNGIQHRVDGPAIKYADGGEVWILNGQLHREDGPAMVRVFGFDENVWYLNDLKHRIGGPAVVWGNYSNKKWWGNGHREWWINGIRHREDGPAYIGSISDDSKLWYLNGKELTEAEFHSHLNNNYNLNSKTVIIDGRKFTLTGTK